MTAVFHYCAVTALDIGKQAYLDGCVGVGSGEALDLQKLREDTAERISKEVGQHVRPSAITFLSVTRLTP